MSSTLVVKFGGAALKDLEGFSRAAEIIRHRRSQFERIIAVVSAMGGMTDRLLDLAKCVSENPPKREQDMLLSVGERISMALLAMVFADKGCEAISFTGSQAGVITCSRHCDARILDVRPKRILPHLEAGKIVIVAGFQGVSEKGEITTLGRGGSDTTAVALAIAFQAERVEFYKDVEGIFEADPKMHKGAKRLSRISYREAFEIVEKAEKKVLHPRALRLAEKNHLPLQVYSFQKEGEGSTISFREGAEKPLPCYEEVCEESLSSYS